ncbi:TonB-dependent receptor [Flavobacterium sp. DG1-102-2]|nr:TonB-dependent receptor [Flavobacterium sp. DG1-102-2]
MRFYYLILAIFMAGGLCAYSQNTISGSVTTADKTPLDGAHIHIEQLHAVTKPDGLYTLYNAPSGQHHVVVSFVGFKNVDTLVTINGPMRLDAVLKPESEQLQEVVLSQSSVLSKNSVHEEKLKTETIEKYSIASLGDALKEVAGVFSLKTGNTIVKPVINGLHSSRVPIISNNVRMEDQQWGTEHAPNLDINSAGKISVIKGANALQYGGDAIGGLVLVEPVSVLKDTLFGKTIVNAASNGRGGSISSSLHQGAEKGWAWNASGTYKNFGDRQSPDYILSNTGNRETNFAGDLKYIGDTYEITASYSLYDATIGIAKAMHIGNVSDLVRAINSGQPSVIEPFTHDIGSPKQEVMHHLGKLNFTKHFEDNSSLSVQYAFQHNSRKEFDIRRAQFTDKPALDLTLITHSAQADWKKEMDNLTLKAGASGSMQKNTADPLTDIRPLIPNYKRFDAGAYGIASYAISNTLTAEAGLRYDFSKMEASKYYQKSRWTSQGYDGMYDQFIVADAGTQWLTAPEFTFHNISASLGIRKQLGYDYQLLANAGLAMRNPNPSELFSDGLHHSNGTIELGNLGIKKEKAYKFSATLLKTHGDFTFEATPYLNLIDNFIYLSPTTIEYTIRGAFPVYQYKQADAVMAGVDLHTNWKIDSHWQHNFTGAYIYGQDNTNNLPLIDMPPLNLTNTIRYTKDDWHNLYLEARSEAVFKQTRYPDNNFSVDIPVDGQQVSTLVDISTPPKGYHLVHFASGMTFKTSEHTSLAVNFSVLNIFNTKYRDYLNRQRLYTDDIGRNFQLQLKFNY